MCERCEITVKFGVCSESSIINLYPIFAFILFARRTFSDGGLDQLDLERAAATLHAERNRGKTERHPLPQSSCYHHNHHLGEIV